MINGKSAWFTLITIIGISLLLFSAGDCTAQIFRGHSDFPLPNDTHKRMTIRGCVFVDSTAISLVEVRLAYDSLQLTAVTDQNGYFVFNFQRREGADSFSLFNNSSYRIRAATNAIPTFYTHSIDYSIYRIRKVTFHLESIGDEVLRIAATREQFPTVVSDPWLLNSVPTYKFDFSKHFALATAIPQAKIKLAEHSDTVKTLKENNDTIRIEKAPQIDTKSRILANADDSKTDGKTLFFAIAGAVLSFFILLFLIMRKREH